MRRIEPASGASGSTRVRLGEPAEQPAEPGRGCRIIVLFDDDPAPGDIREIDLCRAARDPHPGKLVEMIGEAGENRLWGRDQDRAAAAQDHLDDDRRRSARSRWAEENKNRASASSARPRSLPPRYRRHWVRPFRQAPAVRGKVRRLRCDRGGRRGKRLSIKAAAAGAGSRPVSRPSRFPPRRPKAAAGSAPRRPHPGFQRGRAASAARSCDDGISGGGAGFAVAEASRLLRRVRPARRTARPKRRGGGPARRQGRRLQRGGGQRRRARQRQ